MNNMQTKDRVLQIKKCLIFRSVGHACVKHSAVPMNICNRLRILRTYRTPLMLLFILQFICLCNIKRKYTKLQRQEIPVFVLSADFVFVYDARCTCTTVPITSRTLPPALGTVLDQSRTGLATHGTVVYTLPWRVIPVSSVYNILCSPVLAGLLWSREQRGRWHRS